MIILKRITILIIILQYFNIFASSLDHRSVVQLEQCVDKSKKDKNVLVGGWSLSRPYQFNKITRNGYEVSGMDTELTNAIAARVGIPIRYDEVEWKQHQLDLSSGIRDIAFGATYNEDRAKLVYFSIPYRFEKNSLFVLKDSKKKLNFTSIPELLAQIRLFNFHLGVTDGFVYCDQRINYFIDHEDNSDIIFKYNNNTNSFNGLLLREIDGFISDSIAGVELVFSKEVNNQVEEIQLDIETPIHLIFSKKTVAPELVEHFNQVIHDFVSSNEHKNIVKNYLYRILLSQTMNAQWFYIISMIGIIGCAVSGIVNAAKENATLFGAFILAILPSIAGIVARDIIISNSSTIIITSSYIYSIFIVTLIGFFTIKLISNYNNTNYLNDFTKKIFGYILVICDATGQAIFIIIGVSMAMIANIEPIWLYGSFCSFLVSSFGCMIRDLLRNKTFLREGLNYEISVLFGIIFSIFFEVNAHDPSYQTIQSGCIGLIIGVIVTRLFLYYYKTPNLRFQVQ